MKKGNVKKKNMIILLLILVVIASGSVGGYFLYGNIITNDIKNNYGSVLSCVRK